MENIKIEIDKEKSEKQETEKRILDLVENTC